MLGDFITRCLVLIFGYAYPAFECYKTVEKNRVDIHELRFWCQYWIIVAMLTVLERIVDVFISWVPMYGEMKLALIIYLWYPKTKGTGYIYDTVLRPYVTKHELDIDRKLLEWRARVWDLAIFYYQNCTELGQSAFFQVLNYLANQSSRFSQKRNETDSKRPPPSAPPFPGTTINQNIAQTPKSDVGQVPHNRNRNQAEYVNFEDNFIPDPASATSPELQKLHQTLKLRRSKPNH